MSSRGFFCKSSEHVPERQVVYAVLRVPMSVSLNCRVRVVRVEHGSDGYGLGCYIEDYTVEASAAPATPFVV